MDRQTDPFWELIEPEHFRARAFCRKLLGNREDGDDHYQDALVTALTKFADLRDKSAFRPWFYRIVINSFHNRRKRSWWKRFSSLTDEISDSVPGDDPVRLYTARRRLEIAFKAVRPRDRALITLFEMEGWSIRELAGLSRQTEGTIKVRLSRTRRKMRETLTKELPSS